MPTPSRSMSPRATAKCSAPGTAATPGATCRCRPGFSTSTRWRAGEHGEPLRLEIRLDRAAELDGQRIAVAVLGLARGDADPAFADTIFLDIGLLDALEADADVALERLDVVIRAARIVRQAVGRGIGHGRLVSLIGRRDVGVLAELD